MNGRTSTFSFSHLNSLEMVLDGGGEVRSALLVNKDRSESQGVVAVLPQRQVGLGDQLVMLVHVDELVPDLDKAGVYP